MTPGDVSPTPTSEAPIQLHEKCINRGALWVSLRVLGRKNDGLSIGGQSFFRAHLIKQHYTSKVSQFLGFYAQTDNLTSIQYFGILVNNNPYFTHIYTNYGLLYK